MVKARTIRLLLLALAPPQATLAKAPQHASYALDGEPFVGSQSSWKWQKRREIPDRVDGTFTLIPLHLR